MFKFHGISSNINDYSQKWDASTISYCYRQYCYKPRPGIVDQIVLWTGQREAKLRSPRETGERVRWWYSAMGAKGVQVCKRSTNKSWSSKQGSRPSRLRYNSTRGTGHAYEHHCWDGNDWRTQQHNRERKAEIQGVLINMTVFQTCCMHRTLKQIPLLNVNRTALYCLIVSWQCYWELYLDNKFQVWVLKLLGIH